MTQGKDWTLAIEPEPTDEEREAILSALAAADDEPSAWAEAALAEAEKDQSRMFPPDSRPNGQFIGLTASLVPRYGRGSGWHLKS